MAPADGGMEASRRMHEYLLSKQRKQEEYWLRKYGKVLQAPPPSVGKPAANPRLPPIAGGSASGSGQSSSRGSNVGLNGEPSAAGGGLLPPVPGAQSPQGGPLANLSPHHLRQPKGQPPIFRVNEPVKDFFSRNVRQSRTSGVAMSRDEYGNMLPPSHRPPEPYRARGLPSQLPPMANYGQQHQHQHLQQQGSPEADEEPPLELLQQLQLQQQQQQEYNNFPIPQQQQQQHQQHPYGGYPQAQYSQQQQQASPRGGYKPPPRVGVPQPRILPPLTGEASSSRSPPGSVGSGPTGKPLRSLEMELAVIRAIKAREDVLERLRIASGKLDSGFGGSAPVVLSPVDPMVRLFYRLVGTLRQRTLDVIEAIAAWRRKVNRTDPFIYYGVDYLAAIGPDVGFLDDLPFMRSRLTFTRAADDPFLSEVTPDGIPIEEATTCDLRRGGQRFSSEALRIRMARKVLAHYCGRPMPGENSALTLDGGASTMSAGGLHSEPSQPRSVRSALTTGQGAEEEDEGGAGAGGVVMTTEQIIRALSPPVPPVSALQPPAPRAITPPAAADSVAATAASDLAMDANTEAVDSTMERQQEEEEQARREAEAEAEAGLEAAMSAREAQEEAAEAEDVRAVGVQDGFDGAPLQQQQQQSLQLEDEEEEEPTATAATASAELDEQVVPEPDQQPQPQPPQVEDLLMFENDNNFINFALDAMIRSLDPPYVHTIPPGGFSVAGWEIDHQLDEVVRGITSPDRFSRTSIQGNSVSAAAAAADAAPALRLSSVMAASPSQIGGSATAGASSPSRSSGKIPRPPSEPKPPSVGRVLEAIAAKPPSRGSRIPASPPSAVRPQVRVHLKPRNSGLDMALSMDEEGPMTQDSVASATGRTTGRNSSNNSRSSVKPTASGPHAEALPSILEDQSAFYGDADGEGLGKDEYERDVAEAAGGGAAGAPGAARPPVRVHLNARGSGLDMALSMDGEDPMTTQGSVCTSTSRPSGPSGDGAAAAAAGAARPPVRVHLKPRNSGLDMALSMDEEGPMTQTSVATSTARPTGRNSPGSSTLSSRTSIVKQTGSNRYTDSLPSILKDQSAIGAADGGEQEGAGGGADRYRKAAAANPDATSTSRPPLRVHLRPNSREINMVLSMDDDGMLMASPAVQEAEIPGSERAAAVAVPPLDDMPTPLQGSLSGRSNRASLRQARQSGSRPSSAASGGPGGDGQE